MILCAKEVLYHFNCSRCKKWWSIGDHQLTSDILFCPHCGHHSIVVYEEEKDKVVIAMKLARFAHREQKYLDKPYTYHLSQVHKVADDYILNCIEQEDRDMVRIILWLHDALEDGKIEYREALELFGKRVANILKLLDSNVSLPRKQRFTREYYAELMSDTLAVFGKLCDRIANVRECVLTENNKLWEMYKKEYSLFRECLFTERFAAMFAELDCLLKPLDSIEST